MRANTCASIALAAVWTAIVAGSSVAQQGASNPRRGHELAARLCTNCHIIDGDTSGPIRADVPSFPAIANRAGSTAEHLAGRIIVPHPAMPSVSLTAEDVRDLVAYIITLKRND
jgi:cytochrome c